MGGGQNISPYYKFFHSKNFHPGETLSTAQRPLRSAQRENTLYIRPTVLYNICAQIRLSPQNPNSLSNDERIYSVKHVPTMSLYSIYRGTHFFDPPKKAIPVLNQDAV